MQQVYKQCKTQESKTKQLKQRLSNGFPPSGLFLTVSMKKSRKKKHN